MNDIINLKAKTSFEKNEFVKPWRTLENKKSISKKRGLAYLCHYRDEVPGHLEYPSQLACLGWKRKALI